MKLRRLVSLLFFLAGCAVPAAAQNDDYRRCGEYRESNPNLALKYCTAAIQSGSLSQEQLAEARNNRGIAFDVKGERDRGIQDFDEAIRLKPDFAEAFYNRGITFNNRGENDRAIQDYDQAIRLRPNYSEAFNNRGNAFYGKGEKDLAFRDYDQAIRLKPDNVEAFSNRGKAFLGMGESDRAIQDYNQATTLSPSVSNQTSPKLSTAAGTRA